MIALTAHCFGWRDAIKQINRTTRILPIRLALCPGGQGHMHVCVCANIHTHTHTHMAAPTPVQASAQTRKYTSAHTMGNKGPPISLTDRGLELSDLRETSGES